MTTAVATTAATQSTGMGISTLSSVFKLFAHNPLTVGVALTGAIAAYKGSADKDALKQSAALAIVGTLALVYFFPAWFGLKASIASVGNTISSAGKSVFHTIAGHFHGQTDKLRDLFAEIARVESVNGNPDIAFGGRIPLIGGKLASQSTLRQILHWQRSTRAPSVNGKPGTNAILWPQFLPDTLELAANSLGIPLDTVASLPVQNELAAGLLERRGLWDYAHGLISEDTMIGGLKQEWDGLNSAKANISSVRLALRTLKSVFGGGALDMVPAPAR